ncbi:MAG: cell wall hydrolase [Gammaproteobacteria bacterium]|nr:cell wall hydrolase [Gammaproteobacteria bacterium]MDH3434703.1 cell wall hydrolase [Gammaproteobacteria bacterium]
MKHLLPVAVQHAFTSLTGKCRPAWSGVGTLHGRLKLWGLLVLMLSLPAHEAQAGSLQDEHRCLALALYWEARGETRRGMVAVGWTILNRARSKHFPATPCAVIYQGGEKPPCQFSWWCDGKSDRPRDRDSWIQARVIAAELLVDPPPDPTGQALFYHSTAIGVPWKRPRTRTARIGNHIFYR